MTWLDRYFFLSERGSTLRTEILAGISVYLSLSYILIVNPAILAKGGFDPGTVFFATAVSAGLSTILMGLWAKLPFALAPGLEMNGFVAFSAIGGMGLTVNQSLGAVFWSGVLCVLLTWLPIRDRIISSIPLGLQANLAFSVGIFVVTIGLFLSKIVSFENGFPHALGSFSSAEALTFFVGLAVCIVLRVVARQGSFIAVLLGGISFLIAIIVATIFCRARGVLPENPPIISEDALARVGNLDWFPFTNPAVLTVFLVLFLIDFYGSIGKFIGLTASTNLRSAKSGVIGIERAMYVDGIGTAGGAVLGTTSVITYVESAIGIHAGGRTGIVAIVCGLLMLSSLVFSPLVALIPVVATSGVLAFVGYALLPREQFQNGEYQKFDIAVGMVMALLSFVTFSLDKAMLFGFLAYSVRQILSKDEKINPYLLGSACLLLVSVVVQYMLK